MGKSKKIGEEAPKKKKSFISALIKAVAIILVLAIVLTVGVNIILNRDFTVSFYQIRSDKVSDNIRIVELADLHNSEYGEGNSKLIEKIRLLKPDLIFYAGDMMNYQENDYSVLFNLSDKLSKVAPIYACYGNNELDQQLFEDKKFKDELEKHGVNLLSNEAEDVKVKHTVIELIAISDDIKQFDIETNNSKKFLNSLGPTDKCRICLTHYPELFEKKLLNWGIDVAFAGHAHGGHVRIPKVGGLYSNGEGFFPKYTEGVEETEDGAQLVISRGLGNHNLIPRINNQPELVVADICWY